MKKTGFTLIELLAVLVLIAIVALLIAPNIIKTIDNSRKKTFIADVSGVVEAANNDSAKENFQVSVYEINGMLLTRATGEEVKLSGTDKMYGTISFDEMGKSIYAIHNNEWCATKTADKNQMTVTEYHGTCEV